MDPRGSPWILVDPRGSPWISLDPRGSVRVTARRRGSCTPSPHGPAAARPAASASWRAAAWILHGTRGADRDSRRVEGSGRDFSCLKWAPSSRLFFIFFTWFWDQGSPCLKWATYFYTCLSRMLVPRNDCDLSAFGRAFNSLHGSGMTAILMPSFDCTSQEVDSGPFLNPTHDTSGPRKPSEVFQP